MGGYGENLLFWIYCRPVWKVCFLDDDLGVASSYKITLFRSNFVKKYLKNAGFTINEEKSVRKPSQILIWLGIKIN